MLQALKMGWEDTSLSLPSFQAPFVKTARGTRNWVWFWLVDQGTSQSVLSVKCQREMKGPLLREPIGCLQRRSAKQAGHSLAHPGRPVRALGNSHCWSTYWVFFQHLGSFQFTDFFFLTEWTVKCINKTFSSYLFALPSLLYLGKNGNTVATGGSIFHYSASS